MKGPQGLLNGVRDPDLNDLAQGKHARQDFCITSVRLNTIAGGPQQFRGGGDHAADAGIAEMPGQPEAGGSCLVDHPDRGRETLHPLRDAQLVVLETDALDFAGVDVQGASDDAAGMDIEPDIGTLGQSRDLQPSMWHYRSTAVWLQGQDPTGWQTTKA